MKYFLSIISLFLISLTTLGQSREITIKSFTVKPQLAANTADWTVADVNAVAVSSIKQGGSDAKMVIQVKKGGSKICGNNASSASLGNVTTKVIMTRDVIAVLDNCILQPGSYTLCIQFFNADGYPTSDEQCRDFMVAEPRQQESNYTGPQLILPANNTSLTANDLKKPITYKWTPCIPRPPQNDVVYTIRVYEIEKGQEVTQAFRANKPILEKEVSNTQVIWQMPSEYASAKEEHKFVWNVQAKNKNGDVFYGANNGTSEVFTLNTNIRPTYRISQPFCTDFENGNAGDWQTNNALSTVKNSGGHPGKYIETTDENGPSYFYNIGSNYTGDWGDFLKDSCGSLCFDAEYIYSGDDYDGQAPPNTMTPSIAIEGNGFTAFFVAYNSISVGDGWHSYCAPLKFLSPTGSLPSNSDGHWVMTGFSPANWNSLLNNVTRVRLPIDINNFQSERMGYDNICIKNTGDCNPPVGGNICDSLKAQVEKIETSNCCYKINLTDLSSTAAVKGVQFIALSPNSFASKSLGSYSGWMTPVNNSQEFKVRKLSGNMPTGLYNGFFNFCLNALSNPQKIVVNWLKDNDSVICSDTLILNCNIPCVTFTGDSVKCNGPNYNLVYSFTNNSNFKISKIEYSVVSPTGPSVNPIQTTLSNPVNIGQNSGNINISLINASPNSQVCILMKFVGPDSCCWCYDTLCENIPPCICNNVKATLTSGNTYMCCYDLNLLNNYAANYFSEVKLTCLTSGVSFQNFSFISQWGSLNNNPANVLEIANSSGYIPMGSLSNIAQLCFTGYTTTPQYILVEWISNGEVKCRDTIFTNCVPPHPKTNGCAQIINDTLVCLPNGTFKYTFQVQNNDPTHTTSGFQLNPVSPGSLLLSPTDFTSVSIPPNTVSAPQTIIVSGVSQNSTFCFELVIYKQVDALYSWCCHGDTICLKTPICHDSVCNCGKLWHPVVNIQYHKGNLFESTKIFCLQQIMYGPINTSSMITFDASAYSCLQSSCQLLYVWKVVDMNTGLSVENGTSPSLPVNFPTPSTQGQYKFVIYPACNGKICDSCGFYFATRGGISCCPGHWGKRIGFGTSPGQVTKTILCNSDAPPKYEVSCNKKYYISASYSCNSRNCNSRVAYKLLGTGASISNTGVFIATANGIYTIIVLGICGEDTCDRCIFRFVVKDCDHDSCHCGNWKSDTVKMIYPSPVCPTTRYLVCGNAYNNVEISGNVSLAFPVYNCSQTSCPATYTWSVVGPSSTQNGTSNIVNNLNLLLPGTYTITVTPKCGSVSCPPCRIILHVSDGIGCDTNSYVKYHTEASFLASVPNSQIIDFTNNDEGTPITTPSQDIPISCWSRNGISFTYSHSYYNLHFYNYPYTQPITVSFPPGTYKRVGFKFSRFYGSPGTIAIKVYSANCSPYTYTKTGVTTGSYFGIYVPSGIDKIEVYNIGPQLTPSTWSTPNAQEAVVIDMLRFGN